MSLRDEVADYSWSDRIEKTPRSLEYLKVRLDFFCIKYKKKALMFDKE